MIADTLYTATISSEEELRTFWSDANLPSFGFCFIEQSLDECVSNGDGTYTASYYAIEINEGESFSYSYLTTTGLVRGIVGAGIYGVRP
jgi:hypothetical protein